MIDGLLDALQTSGIIFAAEIGDKSFFIALVLAGTSSCSSASSRTIVFLGCIAALTLNAGLAALLGAALGHALAGCRAGLLNYLSSSVFLAFSGKMFSDFRHAQADKCESLSEAKDAVANRRATVSRWQLFATAFITNFIGEFGDKTQFAVIAQASSGYVLTVFAGACLGFVAVTALAVCCGVFVSEYLNERRVLGVGATLFFLFGIFALMQGLQEAGIYPGGPLPPLEEL